jgi:hypothetical protein
VALWKTDVPEEADAVTSLLLIITWKSVAVKLCFFPVVVGVSCVRCFFSLLLWVLVFFSIDYITRDAIKRLIHACSDQTLMKPIKV